MKATLEHTSTGPAASAADIDARSQAGSASDRPTTGDGDYDPTPVTSALPRRWPEPVWILATLGLVATASVIGIALQRSGVHMNVPAAPLFASWLPHVGPGTPAAVVLAVAGVLAAPRMASRLRWRTLVFVGYATAVCWTVSLALVDGWQRGWVSRLQDPNEYLHDLPRIGSVGGFLRGFSSHIVDGSPDSWTTHVSSHPPGATLIFLGLDRVGLGGGAWAATLVVVVGCVAAVAVPDTLRSLGAPHAARAVLPFTVFLPGAVWLGVSADGMFAGVAAVGVALTVRGVVLVRRRWIVAGGTGGLLLGLACYLSYGLALMSLVVLAAVACSAWASVVREPRGHVLWARLGVVAAGFLLVAVPFTTAGFAWWEGLSQLHTRYYQGIAALRPYDYFVWANLAALALSAGPAAAAGLARSVPVAARSLVHSVSLVWRRVPLMDPGPAAVRTRPVRRAAERTVPAALAVAALLAVVIADLSGMSKAETERIWLPFAFWIVAGMALVPPRAARWCLAVQVLTALAVNHLLLTHW